MSQVHELWLGEAKRLQEEQNGEALAGLLDVKGGSQAFGMLRNALNVKNTPKLRAASYVSLTRSFIPEYRSFADFLALYLLYVRDAQLESRQVDDVSAAYSLLEECYRAADRLFAQGETGWFVPTLREFTQALVNLGLKAGRLSGDSKLIKAGEAARILGRPMGVAASDRNTEVPSKRDALFFLANCTFKVYFALSNLRLCDTILNNTQNSTASLDSAYPKADRVAFHYYRGRIFLYQRRLPQARYELRKAFDLCHVDSWGNGRLILTFLVVASLTLGVSPSDALLNEFDLSEQFENLIVALQLGDYGAVLDELDQWQDWHRQRGNYLLLKEKLEVVCWRNLARRTLLIATSNRSTPASGPPTLSLQALLLAARMSFRDLTLDIDDVESMCASLMEQGYIKAYILHSKHLLVLQKGPTSGFPPLSSVNP